MEKVGRNDPCPCGSGKKYKKCCGLENKKRQFSVLSASRFGIPNLAQMESTKSLLGRVGKLGTSLTKPSEPTPPTKTEEEDQTPPASS